MFRNHKMSCYEMYIMYFTGDSELMLQILILEWLKSLLKSYVKII